MMEPLPIAISLAPTSQFLEAELRRRFELIDLPLLDRSRQRAWLEVNGSRVTTVITNGKTGCSSDLMRELPALRIIAVHGVGVDAVDLVAADAREILVTNTPGVLTDDVADLAVGLLISLLRQIPAADRFVRGGEWTRCEYPLTRSVTGRRFGILGLGRIGTAIARRLEPFGTVHYTGRRSKPVPWTFHASAVSLASACDVLIIACAANERTRSIVDREVLSALGPGGYLVNVARGSVVDEAALVQMLSDGQIAGVALDVFADEPAVPSGLVQSDRAVLTPHIGSATIETRQKMAEMVLANLDAFFAGEPPPNLVQDQGS